jgi:hypothetical protein
MHKLDDETLITADLLRKFIAFAGEDGGDDTHFALMQKADRQFLAHNPGSPELDPVQMVYSQKLLQRLNQDLHHDGAWVLLWSHPGHYAAFMHVPGAYSVMNLIWVDRDGDAKVRLEWVAGQNEDVIGIIDLLLQGELPMCDQAETAWLMAQELLRATLDIGMNGGNDVTYRRALGEAAPTMQ